MRGLMGTSGGGVPLKVTVPVISAAETDCSKTVTPSPKAKVCIFIFFVTVLAK
jgi:hypothetical protein